MRTFIAIKFPTKIHQRLQESSQALRRYLLDHNAPECLRWSPMQNAHLTLRFLGETTTKQVDALKTVFKDIPFEHPPFDLAIGGVGCFPNAGRPRVLWLGVGGELAKLHALQTGIEAVAQQCGFEAEKRVYSPHVTLARIRRGASKAQQKQLGQLVDDYATNQTQLSPTAESHSFTVRSISHIQSQLRPEGSVYTTLNEFELVMPA